MSHTMGDLTPAGVPQPFATLGLTFDDVLLQPNQSDVIPSEVDTSTPVSKRISVKIPLISSPMDTVTEARMAVAIARQGGLGVIHRNLSIEDQAHQVDIVKRSEAGMIDEPITISPEATIGEADAMCGRYRISGVPVVDRDLTLLGIVTNRDMRFESDPSRLVGDVMTKMPLVTGSVGIAAEDAMALLARHKIEKLPLVDDQGRLKGLITLKDFVKSDQYPNATKDDQGRLRVGAAVGFFGDSWKRAMALVEEGVDLLVVDTAHGHSHGVVDMVRRLKAEAACRDVDIVGGNVATYAGAKALVDAGRRRGQGRRRAGLDLHHPGGRRGRRPPGDRDPQRLPRVQAGRGPADRRRRPAVLRRHRQGHRGRRGHRDARLPAGRLRGEPGRADLPQRQAVQGVPGDGVAGRDGLPRAQRLVLARTATSRATSPTTRNLIAEGIEGQVPFRGPLAAVAYQLIGGLRQSMFYTGASTIRELHERGSFVRITSAGLRESHPHDIQMTVEAPNYAG